MNVSAPYRSSEPPQPTDVDELFRTNEQADSDWDGYYRRKSARDSGGIAALCLIGMIGLGIGLGLIEIARRVLS